MKEITLTSLSEEERGIIDKAFEVAEYSFSKSGNKVGAVIVTESKKLYYGATIGRTRVIETTCSERMAVDQLIYDGFSKPELVVVVGNLSECSENTIIFPCGVCR